ncbi:hypothetical protein [Arthrobacter methylotrophus]|uniref:hypothetical protein n=1 Tax=Arthrobacter methylotrophus TaxID=121291 RepID=UPI0031ECB6A6
MTQALHPAPDLSDDAILDPNFFDNPEPLEMPAGETVQAPAPADTQADVPKPGYGLFGRRRKTRTPNLQTPGLNAPADFRRGCWYVRNLANGAINASH